MVRSRKAEVGRIVSSNFPFYALWIFFAFLSVSPSIIVRAQSVPSDTALHPGAINIDAFDFSMKDSAFISSVELIFTKDGIPNLYSSTIMTPVCNDGLCQTLEIELYWNLIGDFVGYDTIEGKPLTKFDHLPFTSIDYEKLQFILENQNSVLERKELDELFDKEKTRFSEKEDATTGATAIAVKNAIVEGALYSTYILWHIANGEIKSKIREYTKSIFNHSIRDHLLKSDEYQDQLFALKLLTDNEYESLFKNILILIKTSNPLVEMYILKKLPEAILIDSAHQVDLVIIFPYMDINGKSMLMARFNKIENVNLTSLQLLSGYIDEMTVKQLQDLLSLFNKNHYHGDKIIVENLKNASTTEDARGHYILEYLKKANYSD